MSEGSTGGAGAARTGEPPAAPAPAGGVTFPSVQGRWILLVSILGSGMAGIDATVVNVALPSIGRDLGADFADLQWTVTAYSLTLAASILLGGSLADRYGRRRVFLSGSCGSPWPRWPAGWPPAPAR